MSINPKLPAVEIAVRTDPGRDPDKQVNEDSSVHQETVLGLLGLVCDGMGGHAGGKEASEPSAGRGLFMSRFDKACASYAAKTLQTFELVERLSPDRLFVADYNDLVLRKEELMPRIFEFAGLPFRSEFLSALHAKSVRGASWGPDEARRIVQQCQPVYQRARALATGVSLG